MAVVSNLKNYPMSLVWETERPSSGIARQSSYFRLFGEEWNLKLEYAGISSYYAEFYIRVHLCSKNFTKLVKTGLSGTCHVIANKLAFGGSEQFSVRNSDVLILECRLTYNDIDRLNGSGKWKVLCHFTSGVKPSLLQTIHLSTGSLPASSSNLGIPPDLQRLSDDLSRLLDKEIMPDATLTCGGQTWRVHRSVLTVRSEVFAAMFRSGMSESETGAIRVEDLEPTILDSLLKYVYSGKVPDVSGENVSGLYEAADRYALHGLRKLLSDWMAEHLSNKNCLGFLVVADAHADAELKDATVAFITEHFAQIEKAVWTNFRKGHLHLAVEVLEHFAPAMKK